MGKFSQVLRLIANTTGTALLVAGAVVFAGCGQHNVSPATAPNPNMGQSFQVVKNSGKQQNGDLLNGSDLGRGPNYHIAIARSALGKEFLLQTELIDQVPVAEGSSLKSRIVTFLKRDNSLYMLETTTGNTVTTDLPQSLLLATFPIVRSDSNQIVFNFNAGMPVVYVASDMNDSDFNGSEYDPKTEFQAQQLYDSYIADAQVEDTSTVHRLTIRQVAQLQHDKNDTLTPVEVRYYLSPYLPDKTYQPSEQYDDFTHYGYFQVAPQITESGDSVQYAMRWDPRQTITYAISANTPPQFVGAVKEGALYWNSIFGHQMIKVIMAPAGVTAPNPDYNVIQWVPYDTAGYAYADIQADPRTGQILHAQVFIPSAFVFGMENAIHRKIRKFAADAKSAATVTRLLANENLAVQRAAYAEIRATVAHEVGHTLGLRHNFAGSLAANYTMPARQQLIKNYLLNPTTPNLPKNLVVTSSIMDYLLLGDDIMVSEQIARGGVLSHDRDAILLLYKGTRPADNKWPLFCTDSATDEYYDCKTFDAGSSEVSFQAWESQSALAHLPNSLIEHYIAAKTPFKNQTMSPISEVALPDPKAAALDILKPRLALLEQLTPQAGILGVQQSYDTVGGFNSREVQAAQANYLMSQVQTNGGFTSLLAFLPATYAATQTVRLDQLLRGVYRTGVGKGERQFAFSDDEIKTIEANGAEFFTAFAYEYNKINLEILAGEGLGKLQFLNDPLADRFGNFLTNVAEKVLFSIKSVDVVAKVALPIFMSPLKDRIMAAQLLAARRSENPMWMFNHRILLKKMFAVMVKDAIGNSSKSPAPPAEVQWATENVLVLHALEGSGP